MNPYKQLTFSKIM